MQIVPLKRFLFLSLYFCYNMPRKSEVSNAIIPGRKKKIYEEEKAGIEAEKKQWINTNGLTIGIEPNIAGLNE